MPGFAARDPAAGFIAMDHRRGRHLFADGVGTGDGRVTHAVQTIIQRPRTDREAKDIVQQVLQPVIRAMLEVFEIGDHALQARTISTLRLHPSRWRRTIRRATRGTRTAIQLHFDDLCQDRWEFHQLMALLDRLRLGCQIGATRRAVRHTLGDKLIGALDPPASGAGMPELRAMLGFSTRRRLRGLLITGGRLR